MVGVLGFIVFCIVLAAIASIATRGWMAAGGLFAVALLLGFSGEIRDALI